MLTPRAAGQVVLIQYITPLKKLSFKTIVILNMTTDKILIFAFFSIFISCNEYTAKDGLGGTEFWGILIEQSGIVWVTARGSTTRFDPSVPLPNSAAFTVFTPADGLNCCVQSMYQDRSGNMWWGAGSGVFRFNGMGFYQVKQSGPW